MFGYVITWEKNGMRCMTFRNIDINVYMLESVANKAMAEYKKQMTGRYPQNQLDSMLVLPVEITQHGEAVKTVF